MFNNEAAITQITVLVNAHNMTRYCSSSCQTNHWKNMDTKFQMYVHNSIQIYAKFLGQKKMSWFA